MSEVIIFDKPYPPDKHKEALGIYRAVITGACDKCPHLKRCESDSGFEAPEDAACRKAETT